MYRRVCFIMLCVCLSLGCAAQHRRKAAKLYTLALKNYSEWHKGKAYSKLERAIRKDKINPALYSQLGEWYFKQHYYQEALDVFRRGSANCTDGNRRFSMPLTRCYIHCNKPDSALLLIGKYSNGSLEWTALLKQALFLREQLRYPVTTIASPASERISTKMPESYPCIDPETGLLYFTRNINYCDEDVFACQPDSCDYWISLNNSDHPLSAINTIANEESLTISPDGHYLFFSKSDNRSENGWEQGGYDLYIGYRVSGDSNWTHPVPFHATINTPATETGPTISPDNRTLYFVSDRPGGYGGMDIWVTTFDEHVWQRPKNAGPLVNTQGDETAPFICNDNKTLFFTSDGHTGFGGKDIYIARFKYDTIVTEVVNAGAPINTVYNEEGTWLVHDSFIYFTSDRQGPAGNTDIYTSVLPINIKPAFTRFIKGFVYDSTNDVKLPSAYLYITNKRGDSLFTMMSNRGDASYTIPILSGGPYYIHTTRYGYTEKFDTITTVSDTMNADIRFNVSMLPTNYKVPIHDSLLAILHFDINKVEYNETERQKLYTAIEPFINDGTVIFYVNGYTDNTGNPILNEELSTKRARLVADLLVGYGIEELQIIHKGWGEANTIASNDTEEGQRKNRRVEVWVKR